MIFCSFHQTVEKITGLPVVWDNMTPVWRHCSAYIHDDVIKWKHFPRYWPFVRGIHRSPVNSPHKGQWRGALMLTLICAWINGWVKNREAGDLRRQRAHYDVIVMCLLYLYDSVQAEHCVSVNFVCKSHVLNFIQVQIEPRCHVTQAYVLPPCDDVS